MYGDQFAFTINQVGTRHDVDVVNFGGPARGIESDCKVCRRLLQKLLGQLAFSNVAFFGIGAYASAILTTQLGMPWWVTVIPAGGCAGREGESVTVLVTAPHRITIPFAVDRELTLSGQAVFRCEA